MFYLKDLPSRERILQYSKKYAELDPDAFEACIMLLRTGSDALKAFEKYLYKYNLSQTKFLTLIILFREPEKPLNPTFIAEKLGVKKSTITGIIDGLVKDGLVERTNNDHDRRKVTIMLSESGIKMITELLPGYYDNVSMIMRNITPEILSLLTKNLKHIQENAQTILTD